LAASEYARGRLLQSQGKTAEGLATLRHAQDVQDVLADADPRNNELQRERARIYSAIGFALLNLDNPEPEAALTAYKEALSIRQKLYDHNPAATNSCRDLARGHFNLGGLLLQTGKMSEAATEYRKALALDQKLAEDNPAVTRFRCNLGYSHTALGEALSRSDKREAEAEFRRALALFEKLTAENPHVTEFLRGIEASHYHLYWLLSKMGRLAEEKAEHRKFVATYEKLAVDNPSVPEFRQNQAHVLTILGSRLADAGELREAEIEIRQAIAIGQKLVDDNPALAGYRDSLASSHWDLGNLLSRMGKLSEAEAVHRKALAIRQRLAEDNQGVVWQGTQPLYGPYVSIYQERVADSLGALGRLFAQAGKNNEAMDYYHLEEEVRQKLVDATPSDEGRQLSDKDFAVYPSMGRTDELASCQVNSANFLRGVGKHAEARSACQRALALLEPLAKAHPENPIYLGRLAEIYLRSGQLRCDAGDLTGATSAWKQAVMFYDRVRSSRTVQLEPSQMFLLAGCHAGLSALASRPASGVQAAEGPTESDRAMKWLRQAVAVGYRNPAAYRTENALDSLRSRPDFKLLMIDLEFPDDPFARGD
jgi:tetratricopeptide (TPR) repeat protein